MSCGKLPTRVRVRLFNLHIEIVHLGFKALLHGTMGQDYKCLFFKHFKFTEDGKMVAVEVA